MIVNVFIFFTIHRDVISDCSTIKHDTPRWLLLSGEYYYLSIYNSEIYCKFEERCFSVRLLPISSIRIGKVALKAFIFSGSSSRFWLGSVNMLNIEILSKTAR